MKNINYVKEIDEALISADKTLIHLNNAYKDLSSAQNWGLFDMLGGGFFSTLAKHDHLKSVRRQLELAKKESIHLRKELMDVDELLTFDLDVSDFLSFSDYFFDGFLVDFMVQDKIDKGEIKIKRAISEIEDIKSLLLKAKENSLKARKW